MATARSNTVDRLTVRLTSKAVPLTDEQLLQLSADNSDLRIERTVDGDVVCTSPTGFETGLRNATLVTELMNWSRKSGLGYVVDSSTGFALPNGAMRAPDAAWFPKQRLEGLSAEQRRKFLPFCPDFVVELCSPSDTPSSLQTKMDEYLEQGARLGWLIVPKRHTVYVYAPEAPVTMVRNVESLSADPLLPGFSLDLSLLWDVA